MKKTQTTHPARTVRSTEAPAEASTPHRALLPRGKEQVARDLLCLLHSTQTSITISPSGLWRCVTEVSGDEVLEALSWGDASAEELEGLADLLTDEPVAKAVVWAANLRNGLGWGQSENLSGLEEFYTSCDAESRDLEGVAARALRECAAGRLAPYISPDGGHTSRILVLDSVSVAPPLGGLGLGRRLAARTLFLAGSYDTSTLVLAVAGARLGPSECPEMRAEITVRAAHLLEEIGLEELPSGLWVGATAFFRPGSSIETLACG